MLIYISVVDEEKAHQQGHRPGSGHVGSIVIDLPELPSEGKRYDLMAVPVDTAQEHIYKPQVGKLIVGVDALRNAFGPLMTGSGKDI